MVADIQRPSLRPSLLTLDHLLSALDYRLSALNTLVSQLSTLDYPSDYIRKGAFHVFEVHDAGK